MAIQPLLITPLGVDGYHLADHRIRRCTFRRLSAVASGPFSIYEVECLYPDRRAAIPVGDLEIATPICNACTAPRIFRADED